MPEPLKYIALWVMGRSVRSFSAAEMAAIIKISKGQIWGLSPKSLKLIDSEGDLEESHGENLGSNWKVQREGVVGRMSKDKDIIFMRIVSPVGSVVMAALGWSVATGNPPEAVLSRLPT